MSFGYSSDDFYAIFALAHKVRKELVGAPSQFKEISDKVRSLSIVLQDIDVVSSKSELDSKQRTDLRRITITCRDILIDLEKSVDSDDELWFSHGDMSKKLERVGKRNIWERRDIRDLEDRIRLNVELLDARLRRIASKDSVKSKDENDQMPLLWAAVPKSNVAKVKPLLGADAFIELKKTANDQMPLCWVARSNNRNMVQLSLDLGANIESKDGDGKTALWWAARHNNANMVQLLLDRGANIESKDNDNRTPLLWAVQKGCVHMVKLLLKAGTNTESKADGGVTPLLLAVQNKNVDMVQLLPHRGVNIESKDTYGKTALWWAARNDNPKMVQLLLEHGADVGSQDDDQTPLGYAACSSNKDIFKQLLNAGANVESQDNNDQTPTPGPDALREAVGRFDVQAVEDLLTQAFNDVAIDDLSWLRELMEIGCGYHDIATLLVDEKESPWIFIEPFETSSSGVIVDDHQASCVHQGGDEVMYSPRLVAEEEATRPIGNCHTSDSTETDSIKRRVATSCGLAGVVPVLKDLQGYVVAFDTDDPAVASVAYGLDLSHTRSIIQDCLLRVEAAVERLVTSSHGFSRMDCAATASPYQSCQQKLDELNLCRFHSRLFPFSLTRCRPFDQVKETEK